jgi:hypothetical protein
LPVGSRGSSSRTKLSARAVWNSASSDPSVGRRTPSLLVAFVDRIQPGGIASQGSS